MEVPVFHMASFSRSGETLLQRCLNAHPDIEVVHQINEPDTPEDLELFRFLIDFEGQSLPADHPLLAHRSIGENTVLLLKNAVWTHAYPRQGFTLVRNPFSLAASACRVAPPPDQAGRQRKQHLRWASRIDPLMNDMSKGDNTLDGFLALYNRKMLQDRRDGLPFLRYEDFVQDPETWLRKIVAHLGLNWSERVMLSHENYLEGEIGHGGIKLWKPINAGSMDKFKSLPPEVLSYIYAMAHESLRQYGYHWDGQDLTLTPVPGML